LIDYIKRIFTIISIIPISIFGFIEKDFKILFRKKKHLILSIMLPLIIGIIYVSMIDSNSNKINIMVCDFDKTEITKNAFVKIEGFNVVYDYSKECVSKLTSTIKNKEILFGVVIYKGFTNSLNDLQPSNMQIYYDNSNPAISNLASWKFDVAIQPFRKQLTDGFSNQIKEDARSAKEKVSIASGIIQSIGLNTGRKVQTSLIDAELKLNKLQNLDAGFVSNPITIEKIGIYNKSSLIDTGFSPLFCVLNLFLVLMLCSTGIIYDKRTKLITKIRTSSSTIFSYMCSKLFVFLIISVAQFIILILLFLFVGASFQINIILLIKALLFVSLVNTLIGILIGFISDNEGVAVLISLIITLPLLFLSSMFYPLEIMPKFIQILANILPLSTEVILFKHALLFGGIINNNIFLVPLLIFIFTWFVSRKVK
jgi:ABC-2 type transport system permease protein